MFNWLKEWFEIQEQYKPKCNSCETLRVQLEIANYEKKELLDKILNKDKVPDPIQHVEIPKPRMVPWNVRKQMLEAEDRERAKLLRDAPKEEDVKEFERELDNAEKTRS